MRSVDEHLAACLAVIPTPVPREVPLDQALGLILTEDVVATNTVPAHANSSMDGYAVHFADVREVPVTLPVMADLPAGHTEPVIVPRGQTARIMTGAPMPDGADTVVQVEWTDAGTEQVRIDRTPTAAGQHIRQPGEDLQPGQLLLSAGTVLDPRSIGLLAVDGHQQVRVFAPRVAVLSTGAELVEPGKPLSRGQLYDSNSYALAAAVEQAGATVTRIGGVPDDEQALAEVLERAAAEHDLVITTGGVSAGAYDVVKALLRDRVEFTKVAMRPGMPQGVGRLGEVPIITLPGNPVSAVVSFEVFVRPCLDRLLGRPERPRETVAVIADADWSSPDGKREFARVRLVRTGRDLRATPVGAQQSHLVADLAHADGLAIIPKGTSQVRKGDRLQCWLLRPVAASAPARLTHLDGDGRAQMVDVADKPVTARTATAKGTVLLSGTAVQALQDRTIPKGDALAVARIAGIAAAKRTPDLIPLCHPIAVHGVTVELDVVDHGVEIEATVRTADRTGVEMEALTVVTTAALALIDMVKAVDRAAQITSVRVTHKSGGRSGEWSGE